MIHDTKIVNKGRKDRKTNMVIKKPYAVVLYNKFIKGIDRANQNLIYYTVLKKTVKWSKKVVLYLLKCVLFKAFFVYRRLNTNEIKYKKFLHEVERSWISEVQNRNESISDNLQLPEKEAQNRTCQADSPVISQYTNLEKLLVVGREKRSILQDSVKCMLHIRSEVKLDTFVNSVLFHFKKGLVLRNTIQ